MLKKYTGLIWYFVSSYDYFTGSESFSYCLVVRNSSISIIKYKYNL